MYTLIISSLYSTSLTNHEMLNREVRTDSETAKEIFTDSLELIVPAGKISKNDQRDVKLKVNEAIKLIKTNNITEINLVLNTHGTPGLYDLDVNLIKELIQLLSLDNIRINKLYALMCDGFTKKKASDHRRYQNTIFEAQSPEKPSAMEILQDKLQHLETAFIQRFSIKGFEFAYDPDRELEMIRSFLLDDADIGLSVHVTTKAQPNEDFLYLKNCIMLCRNHAHEANSELYLKATNELGKILHKMKQNISAYLEGNEELGVRSEALLHAVLREINVRVEDLTLYKFEHAYKQWIKAHKMYSEERLAVLDAYCAPQIQHDSLTAQGVSVKQYTSLMLFQSPTFSSDKISFVNETTDGLNFN